LSSTEATSRAKQLLVREYRRHNGDIVTAFQDAQTGLNAGLRGILDKIAEAMKADAVESYVRDAFDKHVAPNAWERKQACRELAGPGGTERDLIVSVFRDEKTIGQLVLGPTSRTASIEQIMPGRYALALDTGRVIWEGTLTEQDSLWAHAFPGEPFDLAAADGRVLARPAWEIPLLGGDLFLRCYPGPEAGRLELGSTVPGAR
jgi:hypothetical protein